MARAVWILETTKMKSAADTAGENSVVGVYATLKKAQQTAEKHAWPLPAGQALVWKDMAKNSDDEAFQAVITAKTTTRYAITRHLVH
jgi:hypothetical protein